MRNLRSPLMIIRTERANECDHILHLLVRQLRLRRHSGVSELGTALFDDRVDMQIRKLIHVSAVRMISWLRIHSNGGRPIAFAGCAMAGRAGFDVLGFAGSNMIGTHIDREIRGRRAATGNGCFIKLPAHLPTRRKRKEQCNHDDGI